MTITEGDILSAIKRHKNTGLIPINPPPPPKGARKMEEGLVGANWLGTCPYEECCSDDTEVKGTVITDAKVAITRQCRDCKKWWTVHYHYAVTTLDSDK